MGQRETNALAERILLNTRADLLREVVRREASLDRVFHRRAERLKKALKTGGAITPRVRREMAELTRELTPAVEKMLKRGAIKGTGAARKQFREIFRGEQTGKGIQFPTNAEALAVAGERIRGNVTVGKVQLSSRLWRANHKTGAYMARQIEKSIRAGKSMVQIADEIIGLKDAHFAKTPPKILMPRYVAKLEDAARLADETGQPNVYKKAVRSFSKRANALNQTGGGYANSMRPVAIQLRNELEGADPEQVDALIDRYMLDKARVHARMIARHETIEAYRDGYRESTQKQKFTHGYKWALSSSHPIADECDILADQNLYGLGPGGYPAGSVPATPHPLDMCIQTAIIDKDHFKRELAKRRGQKPPKETWKSGKPETSEQWLAKQSKRKQQQILGPTRYKIFQHSPEAVLGKDGIPRPVKDIISGLQQAADESVPYTQSVDFFRKQGMTVRAARAAAKQAKGAPVAAPPPRK